MITFISDLIRPASELALEYREKLSVIEINHKSRKDFVTEADQAIEKLLRSNIRKEFPKHVIFGEEYGQEGKGRERWIIDPIDGTSSFVFGQPFFSISIAFEVDGLVQYGAVHAPVLGETFLAERGKGATLNGKVIQVSQREELNQSIFATGFACLRSDLPKNNLPYLMAILPQVCDIRRYGSAALDLAYVAAGRLDGFWEMNLNLYDIAAGKLLVEEAGGNVSDFKGHELGNDCFETFASNGLLHQKMLDVIKKV